MLMIRTLKNIGGFTSKEPMWVFYVNYITQKNIYVQHKTEKSLVKENNFLHTFSSV